MKYAEDLTVFNKNKLMKNKKLIIVAIFLLAGLFYWYEIKPANIMKKCYIWSLTKGTASYEEELNAQESCWHRYGLR